MTQSLTPYPTAGESENLEFKKSTAELKWVGETLCGFLNGRQVLIGVTPAGGTFSARQHLPSGSFARAC